MILELDTSLLKKYDLSINQLVFTSLVLNENQINNQDIHELLSRVNEEDILNLVQRNIIVVNVSDDEKIYSPSKELLELIKKDKNDKFEEFYEVFPVYVVRPDGTKGFLRSNVNKCRKEYNRIIGKSLAMHEHIMNCLKYEVNDKILTGKIGYMKTMWKWLTQHEWECYEEEIAENKPTNDLYGTSVI